MDSFDEAHLLEQGILTTQLAPETPTLLDA